MAKKAAVKRHQIADYLNIGTVEQPEWAFMGTGFTSLTETPGAQTESVRYICDKSASSEVVSYESQFPFTAEQIMSEEAITDIYTIARNHLIGEDAEREYVRVELWNAVSTEGAANTYEARKFTVSVEVSGMEGETKQTISGNLNAVGDPVLGTFNTSTKVFTPAE